MARSTSNPVLRQVHRLFKFGVVGPLSDGQLLDRFVSQRDEAAEAAFEELVIRHGPMVLRVCRGVLHDAHEAEDAFQAVFLVLANRARSISRSASVASWLFGVAHRLAIRLKRSAARRRGLNVRVAQQTSACYLAEEHDPDWEILHEEIQGLPKRLRAPIVLCYLQGLTYDAAADRLGLSAAAIRGRLARARNRLRKRLTRRGVTMPAGFLVASAAGRAHAAIPVSLIHSTIRIALGYMAKSKAAILARGVLHSMLLDRIKVAAILLCLGSGGSYFAWHAFAAAADEKSQPIQASDAKAKTAGVNWRALEKTELAKLAGTWTLVSQEVNGKTAERYFKLYRFTFTRQRSARLEYEIVGKEPPRIEDNTFSMSINPVKSPKEINFYKENFLIQGIYKLEEDRLTICHLGISEADRPKGFTMSDAGNEFMTKIVWVLKRD